tara:strand:- start:803 stop:1108 length:306 start_codon:yes stop_codon:yes gene_type:complete
VVQRPGAGQVDGEDALRVGHENRGKKIDLLLSDVVMPQMGGRELVNRLQPLMPRMKVLLTSGFPAEVSYPDWEWGPSVPFIPKPFPPAELARKVREVLDAP